MLKHSLTPPMRKIKVVLVDNDPDEIFFMLEGFRASNCFEILSQVSSGVELLEFLKSSSQLPDVIITDLNMPGKNGVDIINELKKNPAYSSIKVILTSITSGKIVDTKGPLTEAYLFLSKPSSLLGYKSFANDLYTRIRADVLK
jgi:CheY-like chemotaxis protein